MIGAIEGVLGVGMVAMAISQANRQTPATPLFYRAYTAALGVGALWMLLSLLLSFAPVTKDMTAKVTAVRPGLMEVVQTGVKTRNCRWLKSDAYVTDAEGNDHESSLTWPKDRSPGSSRPVGRHVFDVARIEYDEDVKAKTVTLYAYHSCGRMWRDVTSKSGPFKIP